MTIRTIVLVFIGFQASETLLIQWHLQQALKEIAHLEAMVVAKKL